MSMHPRSRLVPACRVVVRFFYTPDGDLSHLIEVEGALYPRMVLRLALVAIRQRLARRIW